MMLTSNASAFARGDTATINQRSTSAQRACVRRVVEAKESRIGKQPVPVPKGVTYTLKDNHLSVKVCERATRREEEEEEDESRESRIMCFIARARWKRESSVAEGWGVGMSVAWRPPAVGFLCAGGPLFFFFSFLLT
jgi:hypothetical protein